MTLRLALLILMTSGCSERPARPAPNPGAGGAGDDGREDGAAGGDEDDEVGRAPVGPAPAPDGTGEGEGEVGDAPGGECADDPLEPNDSARSASPMRARSERGLQLCPGDDDWFVLPLRDGDGARAGVFADGVRLELRNEAAVILALAAGGEQAEAEAIEGERVYARVSDAQAPTSYDLYFEVVPAAGGGPGLAEGEGEGEGGQDPGGACIDDDLEPNPDPGQARALRVGRREGLALCAGDEDWFSVQVGQGQRLTVLMELSHVVGDLDLEVFGPGGPPDLLGRSAGGGDFEIVAWDAPAAAQVYLRVFGFAGAGNGDYDLSVQLGAAPPPCEADAQEPNDSRHAARALRPGDHDDLTICEDEEEDWFFVDLDEADDVAITLRFRHHEGDLQLDLHNPAGTRIARSASFRSEEVVRHRADRDGRHAFRVYAARVRGAEGAPYELEVVVTTPDERCGRDGGFEPNDSRNQAEGIRPGTHRDLQLCFEEEDWYALTLNGGDEIEVELRFDDDEGDLDMQLFRPGSNSVWERSESHSDNERIAATALQAGDHLLRVFGQEAGYDLIFEVSACEPDAREDNDTKNRAVRLQPGRHAGLTQCGEDEDWYSVDVDAGDDLSARIEFRNSDGNIDLHLIGPVGGPSAPLDESETSGNSEEVSARAERDGAHFLRVFPHRPADAPAVQYTLTITHDEAADRCPRDRSEANDSRFAARDVREGTTRDLTLCGDEDWYEIDVDEGQELTFSVRYDAIDGSPGGNAARLDLELVDPNGRKEDEDRGSAGRASVTHIATRDGDHHLRVVPSPADAELEYEVTVSLDP